MAEKHTVLVGAGSAQAMVEFPHVPEEGDIITIQWHQITRVASRNAAYLLVSSLEVTSKSTAELDEGDVPWIGVKTAS